MSGQKLRPLPPSRPFGRTRRMWVFAYQGVTYYATKRDSGWTVVSEDRQEEPITWNQPSKAEATRLALDRIDRYGADYRPSNAPTNSGALDGITGATT